MDPTPSAPQEPTPNSETTPTTLEQLTAPQAEPSLSPSAYEALHVHSIYNEIAPHFSQTRYKPWPIVSSFLLSLPPGSCGLDIGCGNGKYLPINPLLYIIASDHSLPLIQIASKHQPHSTIIADTLNLPHPKGRFEFAISIAVIHHLSTRERRREGVRGILECLKEGEGKALIYCWALEQKGSRRGWEEGGEQDVMVPWVMKSSQVQPSKPKPITKRKTKNKKTEGERQQDEATTTPSDPGQKQDENSIPDPENEEPTKTPEQETEPKPPAEQTFQRYYHLYKKGELEEDIIAVGGEIIENGYEKDNWWAICRRKPQN